MSNPFKGIFGDSVPGRVPIQSMLPKLDQQRPVPLQQEIPDSVDYFAKLHFQPQDVIEYLNLYSKRYCSFWWRYVIDIPAAYGKASKPQNIQHDSYYSALYWILLPKLDEEDEPLDFAIELSDTSANITYMNEALDRELCQGDSENPFWFPDQILLMPNSQLTVTITDLSGVADNQVKVLIGGVKYRI